MNIKKIYRNTKNKIFDFIYKVMDNRIVNKTIILVSLINLINSYILIRKQHRELIKSINSNDDFFRALGTLGFTHGNFYNLISIHSVDNSLNDEEIYKIATQNIIMVVNNYAINELLLDIIKIEVDRIENDKIKFSINTSAYKLFLGDLFDTLICLMFCVVLFGIYLLYL